MNNVAVDTPHIPVEVSAPLCDFSPWNAFLAVELLGAPPLAASGSFMGPNFVSQASVSELQASLCQMEIKRVTRVRHTPGLLLSPDRADVHLGKASRPQTPFRLLALHDSMFGWVFSLPVPAHFLLSPGDLIYHFALPISFLAQPT